VLVVIGECLGDVGVQKGGNGRGWISGKSLSSWQESLRASSIRNLTVMNLSFIITVGLSSLFSSSRDRSFPATTWHFRM